jgi:sortase A
MTTRLIIERSLWAVGFVLLGYCVFVWGRAEYEQAWGNWALDHPPGTVLAQNSPHTGTDVTPEGTLVGRIEVPRLDLTAVVFEGTSDGTLARGVGHLKGSAAPGSWGNLVLAAHRDTYFHKLRAIQPGDEITVSALNGRFRYKVESTEIVEPDSTDVIQPVNSPVMTLITCYPFAYIGSAPERFIVRARRVG